MSVREAKKRGPIRQTRILIHQRGQPSHQSDVREAKKRANPSNKDINSSEGVTNPSKRRQRSQEEGQSVKQGYQSIRGGNQTTKATSEKPRRGPIRQTRILIHQRG